MNEFLFVDNGGNLQSKGFIIQQKYIAVGRNESVKNPGNFFITMQGPGLPPEGVAIWETSLGKEFIPAPVAAPAAQQAPVQQAPMQQAPMQQAPAAAPAAQQQIPQPQVPQQIPELVEVAKALYSLRSLVEGMSSALSPAAIQARTPANNEGVDILMAGLLKLKFETLELKFARDETGTVLRVILDSTAPLGIKVDNLAAASVVEQIVAAFSENTMVISAIADWQKMLAKMEAEKRDAAKKAKEEAAKKPEGTVAPAKGTGQRATGGTKAAAPATPPPPAPPAEEPEEPEMAEEAEPEEPEQPNTAGAIYPTPTAEAAGQGNGTSDEVAKFKLF